MARKPVRTEEGHVHPWLAYIHVTVGHPCCDADPVSLTVQSTPNALDEGTEDRCAEAAADLVRTAFAAARDRDRIMLKVAGPPDYAEEEEE